MKTQQKSLDLIQDEFVIMDLLKELPRTKVELEREAGLTDRRTRYILYCLHQANNIYRVKGTHIWALADIERAGTG